MAREVVVLQSLWCDPCMDSTPEGEETIKVAAVEEILLAFGPVGRTLKPKTLAVCEAHKKEIKAVERWYRELAQEDPDKPKSKGKARPTEPVPPTDDVPFACAACGVPSKSDAGLKQHIRKHHIGQRGYDKIAAGVFTVTNVNDDALEIDFGPEAHLLEFEHCEFCPVAYDARLYDQPAKHLRGHLKRTHASRLAKAS